MPSRAVTGPVRNSRVATRRLLVTGFAALMVATGLAGLSPSRSEAATPSTYVALGDSFASGDGISPALGESGACARSLAAYPELVSRAAHFTNFDFIACSGATTSQVSAQVTRSHSALASAELVTMDAGGNDLSFSGLLRTCIGLLTPSSTAIRYFPGVSGTTACDNAVRSAAALLGAKVVPMSGAIAASAGVLKTPLRTPSPLERRLLTLYRAILRSMGTTGTAGGRGQLVVVQYPMLLADSSGSACRLTSSPISLPVSSPVNGLYPGFSASATRALIVLNQLLNRETAAVVVSLRDSGVTRLSSVAASSFAPIDCARGTSNDLYGIEVSPASNGLEGASLHPTSAGQLKLAAAVLARWSVARNAR